MLKQVEGFEAQMKELVAAYMKWEASLGGASLESAAPTPSSCDSLDYEVQVLDIYRESLFYLCLCLLSKYATIQVLIDIL